MYEKINMKINNPHANRKCGLSRPSLKYSNTAKKIVTKITIILDSNFNCKANRKACTCIKTPIQVNVFASG